MQPRQSKYHNKKTIYDGRTFDSKKEASRYAVLKQRQEVGEISDLQVQPRFPITHAGRPVKIRSSGFPNGRAVYYKADFSYIDNSTGQLCIEDTKGMDTPVSRLKRALVESIYGIVVEVV